MDNFSSSLNFRGDLRVIRRDAYDYRILSVWEKKNVITYNGTDSIIRLLAPNAALGANIQEESQIKSMRFGTNATAPQRTDTNLLSEAVVSGNPVRIELLDANRIIGGASTVEYVATLGSGDGNGVTYREAGLFTRGTADAPLLTTASRMFARQAFSDQVKTIAVVLEFRWRITITA